MAVGQPFGAVPINHGYNMRQRARFDLNPYHGRSQPQIKFCRNP
jgi:hypothetical protein